MDKTVKIIKYYLCLVYNSLKFLHAMNTLKVLLAHQ